MSTRPKTAWFIDIASDGSFNLTGEALTCTNMSVHLSPRRSLQSVVVAGGRIDHLLIGLQHGVGRDATMAKSTKSDHTAPYTRSVRMHGTDFAARS